ncbi:Gfo/Idh/MocA family oxidoreductase [Flavobacteriaceae bacterium F89]|uniref:Gfo/Idh/MocA family oxidoreductase n=1 Tax=Cerina litoralis TaxID=2874477 RepID=A0AAE3EXS8_9FLAO|nr:Gfo/Idh/MocA family oxidoreductase [Cerina litoralis]MCG2462084.1 Gfo/Idh/MocA family oxidoreductase [Cerina litoralis]
MKALYDRRNFIKTSSVAGIGLGISGSILPLYSRGMSSTTGKRVGIIGLDTSHCVKFTKEINSFNGSSKLGGYKVVAAYPQGSLDIESSTKRIPGYTEEVRKMGVEIVDSIPSLLEKVDLILLETNDGRRHLEQSIPVLKAGKPMFIDKPIAASLSDAIVIVEVAKHYKAPFFSSSSLRFMSSVQDIVNGKIGKVLGADVYSPYILEKTHPDFFWYGIHGVEMLYSLMGRGCKTLTRFHTDGAEVVVGTWDDGRLGTLRCMHPQKNIYGTPDGEFGGIAFGETGDAVVGPFEGYNPLLIEIIKFFQTSISPVNEEVTLEICAFMEAADESKRRNGASVVLDEIWSKAKRDAQKKLKNLI